jgi:hypothetical protein
LLNFALPFLILIRNTSKRILGTLGFACILIIVGHWVDFYQQIKPGAFQHAKMAYEKIEHAKEAAKAPHTTSADGHHETAPATEGHHEDAHNAAAPAHEAHGEAHHGEEEGLKSFYMGIHFPGLIEIGTTAGFAGLFLFIFFSFLAKGSLVPKNDAYYEESEHHIVV